MRSKVVVACLALLFVNIARAAFTIQDISVGEGTGMDEKNPIREKTPFSLRCRLQMQNNAQWVYCGFTHVIKDEYTSDRLEKKVICHAGTTEDSGKVCKNAGGTADSTYYNRITMTVSGSECGIRISAADPRDSGRWECAVAEGGSPATQMSGIEIFVSNQSRTFISDPDLVKDPKQVVMYDLEKNSRNNEIETTCRAYGGNPVPKFIWYFRDDRTPIDVGDYTPRFRTGQDPILGKWVEEMITWKPTVDDLCRKYKLNLPVCQSNSRKNRQFNFNLLCRADQGDFYRTENLAQDTEVIVEVGAAGSTSAKFGIVLAAAVFAVGRWW